MAITQERMPTSLAKIMIYAPHHDKELWEKLARKENRSLSNWIVTTLQKVATENGQTEGTNP